MFFVTLPVVSERQKIDFPSFVLKKKKKHLHLSLYTKCYIPLTVPSGQSLSLQFVIICLLLGGPVKYRQYSSCALQSTE